LRADPGAAPGERNIEAPRRRRSIWPSIAVVAAAAAFGGVIWYAYKSGHDATVSGPPPLIKADTGPVKVKPDQPGGQEVPFQDSTVYDRLGQNGQKPQVEKLLPPPEPPVPRPQPVPQAEAAAAADPGQGVSADPVLPQPSGNAVPPNDSSPTALAPAPGAIVTTAPHPLLHPVPSVMPHSALAELPKKLPPASKSQATTVKPVQAPPQPAPKAQKPMTIADLESKALQNSTAPIVTPAKPVPASKPAAPAKPPAPALVAAVKPAAPAKLAAAAKPTSGGSFRVQLMSVRTPEAAATELSKLKRRFPDLANVSTVKAEIPGKGTVYRLQAGPFEQSGAKSMCDHMRAQGLGCIVVKP